MSQTMTKNLTANPIKNTTYFIGEFISFVSNIHFAAARTCLILLVVLFSTSCKKDAQSSVNTTGQQTTTKKTPTIVIMGSSTAAGVGANPIDSCWADIVQSTINKNGVKANFINLAYGGYTTYDIMPGGYIVANRPVPDTTRNITKALSFIPDLIMISLPSNDIADGFSDSEILSNYSKLTHLLDSAKVKYIIFSTQPRDFSTVSERMRLNSLNNEIIAAYPNHVNNFLSQLSTSTFQIDSIYSAGDGIHLNDGGHRIIANATLKQPILMNLVQ